MNRFSALHAALVTLTLFLIFSPASAATVIHVPADQPTIQAAINSASNGDTVLVSPGTYLENISYLGKAITVESSSGAKLTTIDGGQVGAVVTFSTGETNASVLNGFTIRNGKSNEGGGIAVSFSSPTIMRNTITQNSACDGAGIGVQFGSPIIQNNVISYNVQGGCGGLGGGGILIGGASSAQILKNTIVGNSMSDGGGGISLWAAGTTLIQDNAIRGNKSQSSGGGIAMVNVSDANIIDNIISGNTAWGGGGLYWLVPSSGRGPYLISNTIANNNSKTSEGSEIYADGYESNAIVSNNIIVGRKAQTAFFCGNFNNQTPPVIHFDDVYNAFGTTYGGICTDQTGHNGNISADPQFVTQSNVRLKGGSPAVDAGNNTAPDLPTTDFAGNPRIVNGNGGPIAYVDIGAYEFIPASLSPTALNFGVKGVGSITSKTVVLANSQNKSLDISSTTVPTGYLVSGCGNTLAAFTSCSLTVTFQPSTTGSFKGTLTVNDDAGNGLQSVLLSGVAQ